MNQISQFKDNIAGLKLAIEREDKKIHQKRIQLNNLQENNKKLDSQLEQENKLITHFDNESFMQSMVMSPTRSRLKQSTLNMGQSQLKYSAIPIVDKAELDESRRKIDRMATLYQQTFGVDDPILKKLHQNLEKEQKMFESHLQKYLTLYEHVQKNKMMKDAIQNNMKYMGAKKDSKPQEHQEQSINKIVVKRGFTSRMLELIPDHS